MPGSYDGATKVQRTLETWVLENGFLKVTLLPEYGGRIISIIYKPIGHEALYRNPVGVPYQIRTGVFYYDWLMVYGGIFPTFPEPELLATGRSAGEDLPTPASRRCAGQPS